MTFNDVKFQDVTPGHRRYDNDTFSVSSPTKKGTVVVIDTSNAGKVKAADLVLTSGADNSNWVGMPKILAQNVRDLDGGAVQGFRDGVNSDANLGDKVALIHQPGSIIRIGRQNSTDKQAGWVGSITRGDRLYVSCNTTTGAQDGGIWNLATFTNSSSQVVFCMPIGEARNSVSAASDILEFEYNPGFVHGSLYST